MRNHASHSQAVVDGSWLHQYMAWCGGLETPKSYDFWCGLWVLSNVIGRQLHVARPEAPVFLNLYAILCADAGITRKSTAVNRAFKVLNAARLDYVLPITAARSPQALLEAMARHAKTSSDCVTSICVSELVTLLGREGYNIGMPGLLTDLYDCPSSRIVMRSGLEGHDTITNLYPTLLAATTSSWLVRAINPDVIEGGFTSRCLFIIEDKPKRMAAWPQGGTQDQHEVLAAQAIALVRKAKHFTKGKIELNKPAMEQYIAWYESREVDAKDAYTLSFQAREDHHVLRLAALLSVSEDEHKIGERNIVDAIAIIERHRNDAAKMFGVGKDGFKQIGAINIIRDTLLKAGPVGVNQAVLTMKCKPYINATMMVMILEVMHELEMVQRFDNVKSANNGRPATIWRATKGIVSSTGMDEVIKRVGDV